MRIKRKIYTVVALLALIVAGLVWGVHWWQTGRYFEETDNAYVHTDSVAIRAETSGRVMTVPVKANQHVQAGMLLVELDATDARAQLAQATAALAVARADETRMQRQYTLQEAQIKEVETQIASAQAEVDQAQLHLERSRRLASQKYTSEQQRQDDEADLAVARANLAARRAAVVSARKQLEVIESQQESARASREAAEADLAESRHRLAKTRLKAPMDGVVGNLSVEPGTLAQPSLTLMQLVPVQSAYVIANYKETQTARMRPGQPVHVHVDAYPDIAFEGVVNSLAPSTGARYSLLPQDNATGNFNKIVQRVPVRIHLTGPREALGQLRDGLSVVPEVDTRELKPRADDTQDAS
ncbi:HlyD family secretion protein [Halomonas sp. WWR20]